MFVLTTEHVRAMIKNDSSIVEWHEAMIKRFDQFDINTPERIAGIVTQCNFNVLEEDVSEKTANSLYANKHGNGDEASGDGWKFRARGCIKILGRTAYTNFGKHEQINRTPDEVAEYIESKVGSLAAACWLWSDNNANKAADDGDLLEMTKLMNGKIRPKGTVPNRTLVRYTEILGLLNGDPKAMAEATADAGLVLSQGDRGMAVERLQVALARCNVDHEIELPSALKLLEPDTKSSYGKGFANGLFGTKTTQLLREFQKAKGLKADGIAGNVTLNALDYFQNTDLNFFEDDKDF